MPPHSTQALIWHALEAAHAIRRITTGYSLSDYLADEKARMAVERGFTIIGEALGALRRDAPHIAAHIPAVNDAIGLRNVLVHGYADVDDDTVWHTATVDIAPLIDALQRLLHERETTEQ